MYPANFLEIWRLGREDRDDANRYLLEECGRLGKQLAIIRSFKNQDHRKVNLNHRRSKRKYPYKIE
ncbi:hypothetical protein NEPAR08_1613 [Nematocida parisii]|nr:hypothetical protein NEPAR08_1613 [Nematocida parisii]